MSAVALKDIYRTARKQLETANIDTAALDARLILKHVLNIDERDLITGGDTQVPADKSQLINTFLHRRIQGEPISKMMGMKEFWSLDFKVTRDTLDPRPDTETLVQAALDYFADAPPATLLDLGTGTGCMPVTLLSEWPEARAVAVDISPSALAVARDNADMHGVADRITFIEGNWAEGITDKFDLIVSNPPYIPHADIESLSGSVKRFDPILALDGGNDGLDCYKKIISTLKNILNSNGICLLESGCGQHEDITRLAIDAGLCVNRVHADLAGIPRAVEISSGEK